MEKQINSYEDLTDITEALKRGKITPEINRAITNVIWVIFQTAQPESPEMNIGRECRLKVSKGPAEQVPPSYMEVSFRIPL